MINFLRQNIEVSDTISMYNINFPYWILKNLSLEVERESSLILQSIDTGSLYYDGKEISIESNGISGLFKYYHSKKEINLLNNVSMYSERITKDSAENIDADHVGVLNLSEIPIYMSKTGYLSYVSVFEESQNISDYPISNLMSYGEMLSKAVKRGSGENIHIDNLKTSDSNISEKSMFNIGTMKKYFMLKNEELDSLSLSGQFYGVVKSKDIELNNCVMSEGYYPSAGDDIVSVGYLEDNIMSSSWGRYNSSSFDRFPMFISNPLYPSSPCNVKTMDEVKSEYVHKDDQEFVGLGIARGYSDIEDNDVITVSEAASMVRDYFNKIHSPSVGGIKFYEKYIESICDSDGEYVPKDMEVPGGEIYIGFDETSKYSVLNHNAVQDILYNKSIVISSDTPIVYRSGLYFSDQDEINKLAAYAQKVGYGFDINSDNIAFVFEQIKNISSKICAMSPSIIPSADDPLIPEFKAEAFFIPPSVSSVFVPTALSSFLMKPNYYSITPVYPFVPPLISSFTNQDPSGSQYLSKPIYVEKAEFSSFSGPEIGSFSPLSSSFMAPSLSVSFKSRDLKYFSVADEYSPYMSLFFSSDGCDKRYSAQSSRHVNMMEALILARLVDKSMESRYYMMSDSDHVIRKPQMLALVVGDVFCRIKSDSNMRMSIDIGEHVVSKRSIEDGSSSSPGDSDCIGAGANEYKTLTDSNIDIFFEIDGFSSGFEGTEDNSSLMSTEILGEDFDFDLSVGSAIRYGSDEYQEIVKYISDLVLDKVSSYYEGNTFPSSGGKKTLKIGSLSNVEEGMFLYEYLTGFMSINGGEEKKYVPSQYGIFSDTYNLEPTNIDEALLPYSNVSIGNHGETPPESRRDDIEAPSSGKNKVWIWRPEYSAGDSNIDSLEYLGLSDETEAIFSVYGPIVLIYKEDEVYHYDQIGVEVSPSTYDIGNISYHTIEHDNSRVILGDTRTATSATKKKFTRDFCDDWISPFRSFGNISISSGTISPLISQGGGGNRDGINRNIPSSLGDMDGCNKFEPEGSSGIDPRNIYNISSLENLDPASPEQEEGDVPGAYSFKLRFKVTKYAPIVDGEDVVNVVDSTNATVCVTFGVIDGVSNENGDIIAQGYSQDELPEGEDIVYISPDPKMKNYSGIERITIGEYDASKCTLSLASLVSDKLIDSTTGDRFVEFHNITNNAREKADVVIHSNSDNQERDTPFGVVLIGDLRTPGTVFSYKHMGQDPSWPVVTGYSGSVQVDFINGSRLVGNIPSPIPNVTYTESETSEAYLDTLDLTVDTVHFFVNKKNIEVIIRDSKAVFSENRTVKILEGE